MSHDKNTFHIITGLGMGGAEQMLKKVIQSSRFPAKSHIVYSLLDEGVFGQQLAALGCKVFALNLQKKSFWKVVIRFFQVLKKVYQTNPDRMICWMYHGCLFGTLLRLLYFRKIRLIWNIRHTPPTALEKEKKSTALLIRLLRYLSFIPNAIVYNSYVSASFHETHMKYPKTKTKIIPNGFDLSLFKPNYEKRISVRTTLNISEDVFLVGHVARFHPMKDHETLLKSFRNLVDTGLPVAFILFGKDVNSENKKLTELIGELNLSHSVHLMGQKNDVHNYFPSLDLFMLSSAWGEGFPNVIGEAMASAVPCVVTKVGDSATVVADCGTAVEPNNANALAMAALDILKLPKNERAKLGLASREHINKNYTIDKIAQYFDAL